VAIAYGTPFVSGKDSLNNEFSYVDEQGNKQTVAIPPSLLITALGQIEEIEQAVTMDLKQAGSRLYLVGATRNELGGMPWSTASTAETCRASTCNRLPGFSPRCIRRFAAAWSAVATT
jgi:phosphoribosylformylglycinamidine synthase